MRPWLYRNRHAILAAYALLALTITLVLQILESQGVIP